jgi:hypothetical protein
MPIALFFTGASLRYLIVPAAAVAGAFMVGARYIQDIYELKNYWLALKIYRCFGIRSGISELEDEKNYAKMNNAGEALMKGFKDAVRDVGIEAVVQGYGPLFSIIFTDKDSVEFPRDLMSVPIHPHIRRAAAFYQEMANIGVYNLPTRATRWCLSRGMVRRLTASGPEDLCRQRRNGRRRLEED